MRYGRRLFCRTRLPPVAARPGGRRGWEHAVLILRYTTQQNDGHSWFYVDFKLTLRKIKATTLL